LSHNAQHNNGTHPTRISVDISYHFALILLLLTPAPRKHILRAKGDGSMSAKDWLVVLVVPLGLAFLPLIWAYLASKWRRLQFEDLIYREIEEAGPRKLTSEEEVPEHFIDWTNHHPQKRFLHIEILEKPTENRDFIFALRADLVYNVTQLWKSKANAKQWINFLNEIEKQMPTLMLTRRASQQEKIREVKNEWFRLMMKYKVRFEKKEITDYGLEDAKQDWQKLQSKD
jgi:hypothetical protein